MIKSLAEIKTYLPLFLRDCYSIFGKDPIYPDRESLRLSLPYFLSALGKIQEGNKQSEHADAGRKIFSYYGELISAATGAMRMETPTFLQLIHGPLYRSIADPYSSSEEEAFDLFLTTFVATVPPEKFEETLKKISLELNSEIEKQEQLQFNINFYAAQRKREVFDKWVLLLDEYWFIRELYQD